MKLDGKALAHEILSKLAHEVKLIQSNYQITPHLAVVLIGNDPSSLSYIRQKKKAADKIGVRISIHHFNTTPVYEKIARFVRSLALDTSVHAIIVQRPLPPSISGNSLTDYITAEKDVDGFHPKSLFTPPVALAIFKLLNELYFVRIKETLKPEDDYSSEFMSWLRNKKIVLLGRGLTAGKPIAETLTKHHLHFIILNSQSENTLEYLKAADIVISAVGKPDVVTPNVVKKEVVLIGVGLHEEAKNLRGDYQDELIKNIALAYTPTPGGAGPVNVACLMQNVVTACQNQLT